MIFIFDYQKKVATFKVIEILFFYRTPKVELFLSRIQEYHRELSLDFIVKSVID
jgi:hypothetical protein